MPAMNSDIKFTINAAFFQEIKEDHQHINELRDKLGALMAEPAALGNHCRRFKRLLAEFRDQLAFHFTLEEAYGYFEDALEGTPWLHGRAGQLRSEHEALYLQLSAIAEKAQDISIDDSSLLEEIAAQYSSFCAAFHSHEKAEMKLILEAMNQDFGEGE
ncbi:MAG TPA: hypothetical protein DDW52_13700 [Planctomycetaceae bacterium]|nr:hypothetical protein [Planctomycetaceae bacterium]